MARDSLGKRDCWVVIPAYNEEGRIGEVVRAVRREGFPVVVVDDGSRDATAEEAERAGATVLTHILNLHKGASMLTGADYAVAEGAKAVVFMDGDGQHAPDELPLFHRELRKGKDIVFGARRSSGNMPPLRRLGKFLIRTTVRVLYGLNVHDVLSGYRGMTADAYRRVRWESTDYRVETEMIALAGKAGLDSTEVTIKTIYLDRYKGVTVLDGLTILWNLIWWRFTK